MPLPEELQIPDSISLFAPPAGCECKLPAPGEGGRARASGLSWALSGGARLRDPGPATSSPSPGCVLIFEQWKDGKREPCSQNRESCRISKSGRSFMKSPKPITNSKVNP